MKWNANRARFVYQSRNGPVGRLLAKKGVRIESVAKALATEEKLVRTGRYRSSIAWQFRRDALGLFIRVGSAVPHARILEHGSPAHEIRPRLRRALWWTHGADRGWVVPDRPLPRVRHPGTRAYRIISRAVRRVLIFG